MEVGCVGSQLGAQHYLFLASPLLLDAGDRSPLPNGSISSEPSNTSSEENLGSPMESIFSPECSVSLLSNRFSGNSQLFSFFRRSAQSIFRPQTQTRCLRHTLTHWHRKTYTETPTLSCSLREHSTNIQELKRVHTVRMVFKGKS